MPATLLQSKSGSAGVFNPVNITLNSAVSVGQLVVVCIAGWQRRGYTVTDDIGNTYTLLNESTPGGSFGTSAVAYTYVTTAGTPTVRITNSITGGAAGLLIATVRVYSFPGSQFDQDAFACGWYGVPGVNSHGGGTGNFTLADTLVVSSAFIGGNSPYTWTNPSPSGDDLKQQNDFGIPGGTASYAVFERSVTGPGTGVVNLFNTNSSSAAPFPCISTATFSAPLARPTPTTKQYAIRAGVGSVLSVYPGQQTVRLSLGYMPAVGSLIVVGVGCGRYFDTNAKSFTVSDAYGNAYQSIQTDTQTTVNTAMFVCQVENVPTTGVFQITMSLSTGNGTFDASSIAVAEYPQSTAGTPIIGKPLASDTAGLIKTQSAAIPKSSIIVGLAQYFPLFGSQVVSWTDSGQFSVVASLTYPVGGNTSYTQVNESRLGLSGFVELIAPTDGTYAAEVQLSTSDSSVSMVMVAIPLVIPVDESPASPGGFIAIKPNHYDLCLIHEYKLYNQIDPDRLRCGKKPSCFLTDPRLWDQEATYNA